jgi:hypothetical protein
MFLFPGGSTVSVAPATITFTDSSIDATARTVYTFTSQAFGTASTDRKILVAVAAHRAPTSVTSVTIGGVSATNIITQGRGSAGVVALYLAAVPTGTTGSVVITFPSTATGGGSVGVWGLTGTSATATDTDSEDYGEGDATNFTLDVNVLAGGVAIATAASGNSGGTHTTVWSGGVTENYDTQVGTNEWHSGASNLQETASTPLNIVGNPDASPHRMAVACTFPAG